MTKARISKDGVFIAKPGRQIEEGGSALSFSPAGAQQPIYDRGTVALADYSYPDRITDHYKRGVVNFASPFASPPLCYCYFNSTPNPERRWIASSMELGLQGSTVFREPYFFWYSTTTALFVFSRFVLSDVPSAYYVITRNEAS
ncbi:hypothetical protein [Brucella anthropi]|uniref:hypothetical protein n=1 Tax=Brucella anthropi TaxID=529 RepID=UPI0005B90B45|nr:hypothetical protein [Brucella anthropi]KIU69111.1 hypothetical protein TR92_07490 [Brucella anthropi]